MLKAGHFPKKREHPTNSHRQFVKTFAEESLAMLAMAIASAAEIWLL
jgi:hypothetical protein